MGTDFLYRNNSLLRLRNISKYRNYKMFLALGRVDARSPLILDKKKKINFSPLRDEGTRVSLRNLLYLTYRKNLYLYLYKWVSLSPNFSILSESSMKVINGSYKNKSYHKFRTLNNQNYVINYKIFEKLLSF